MADGPAVIGLCGAGVAAIALTKSGTGSSPTADPPAMGAPGGDDGGPAHDLDDGVIAPTSTISPQSCSPVTFTFPANIGNTKLDVTTATLDRTGAGVFLTPTLTISRGATAPEASSPTGIIDELVVTDIGTVTVHPARSGTVGPRAYGTLPTSDEDIDDLSNVTSSCDQWGIAAHTESVTIDDLVAFLERVTIAS